MKNLHHLLILTAVIGMSQLNAQNTYGFKTGYNYTNATVDGAASFLPSPDGQNNFHVGAMADIQLHQGLYFHPELLYIQKGFSVSEGMDVSMGGIDIPVGIEVRTHIKYIEAPLLLRYYTGEQTQFYLEAGPTVAYAIDADLKERANLIVDINIGEQDLDLTNDLYNRFELGLAGGAGVRIPVGKANVDLGLRYEHALTDMLDDPIVDIRLRNYGLSASAGVSFKF